jgi:hypothetical protein
MPRQTNQDEPCALLALVIAGGTFAAVLLNLL